MIDLARLGLSVNSDGFVKADTRMKRFNQTATRTDKVVERSNRIFAQLARTVGAVVAAYASIQTIQASIRVFADFESTMASVQAVSRATAEEFEQLNDIARELGATTEFTAAQAAEGLRFLSMAGFEAAESVAAIPSVLNLATAAAMDLGAAADITSNIMSAFAISADNAESVADTLAAASSRANTTVSQLGDAMSYVGPVAQGLGVDMSDAAAAIGVLSDAGIQGSSAGTGLRRVMSSLANPTSEATRVIRDLNIEMADLNPATNDLTDIIGLLGDAGIDAAQALTIFGDRGGPAILALTENAGRLNRLTEELRSVEGEASRMAETMRDTLTGDMQGLRSAIDDVRISFVDTFDDRLRSLIQSTTEAIRGLPDALSELAWAFRLVAEAAAFLATVYVARLIPATTIAASASTAWAIVTGGPVVRALVAARAATIAQTAAITAMNRAVTLLGGPAGVMALAVLAIAKMTEASRTYAETTDLVTSSVDKMTEAQLRNLSASIRSTMEVVDSNLERLKSLKNPTTQHIRQIETQTRRYKDLETQLAAVNAELGALNGPNSDLFETVGEVEQALGQMAESTNQVEQSTVSNARAAAIYQNIMNNMGRLTYPQYLKSQANVIEQNDEMIEQIKNTIDPTRELEETISDLWEQFESGALGDITSGQLQDYIDKISEVAQGFNSVGSAVDEFSNSMMQTIGIMRGMTEEGTTSYKTLTAAMQALNVVQAVNAVLNQASGDPYSAFARMAAMAAAVASLGVSVGSISGGVSDPTEARQASQGTGTVLGDPSARSESIANAIESIEETNSQIVNINTGMLRALMTVQQGISAAATRVIQGRNMTEMAAPEGIGAFSGVPGLIHDIGKLPLQGASFVDDILEDLTGISIGGFLDSVFDGVFGTLFGGGVDQIDEGIRILGGRLEDVINSGVIEAFAVFEIDGGWFRSDKVKTRTEALGQQAQAQFQLVFDSIADTVREGGAALGIPVEEIERRVNNFNVAMQTMSFEGMDSDEQMKALEAYFSTVFDNLTNAAIPFIDEFQRAGEGLGETMARTANQIGVFQEAANSLGIAVEKAGSATVARAANTISELMGGVESFAQGLTEFEDTFLSEQEQFTLGARRLREAMGDLDLPETREGFMELVRAQDLYTESGQRNIATLLRLQGRADEYYDFLEERAKLAAQVDQMFGGLGETIRTSLMTQEELYNYQKDRVHDLTDLMAELTDIDAIERTAAQIERTVSNMWSSLDETQRGTLGEDFLTYVDEIQDVTQGRIEESLRNLDRGREGIESVIANDMQPAADAQVDAARRQQSAAAEMMNAAQLMSQVMSSRGRNEVNAG